VLETVLARCDWRRDLIVVSQTSQDTLDYTGPRVNHGSKALWMGLGEAARPLPERRDAGATLPEGVRAARPFCRGCLVLEGRSWLEDKGLADRVARFEGFREWPLLVLVDDAAEATSSTELFLWTTFTRMEPAADVHARATVVERFHVGLEPPVVFDCRMKPWYPEVLVADPETVALVDRRWSGYGLPS
jgi:3-polyprenyl-4-hydroxybenzoate decarboxylase